MKCSKKDTLRKVLKFHNNLYIINITDGVKLSDRKEKYKEKEVGTTFTLLADINDAKKELAELEEEQEHLLLQKERLMDDEYVKSWARGEFLLVKEGEEIYRLPGN